MSVLILLALIPAVLALAIPQPAGAEALFTSNSETGALRPLVEPPPTVTSIEPPSGTSAGGTSVTIQGTGFVAGATVTIGNAATSVAVISPVEIRAETAATAAGADEVIVADSNGTSTGGPTYTYIEPPAITSIEPSSGTTVGGTSVTITGEGFGESIATNTVTIGGTRATVTAASATSLTILTPRGSAGARTVSVTNTTDGLSVIDAGRYTYIDPPAITSINPASGPTAGGTTVTITGTGFGESTATNAVTVGGAAASIMAESATSLTVVTPHGSPGAAAVVVTNTHDGLSVTGAYTYIEPPAITSIEPSSGTTAGGTSVTITGTGFGASIAANTVTIGGHEATVTAASATSLTVVTPSGSPGAAAVMVTDTTDGLSVTKAGAYTYFEPPTLPPASPAPGPGSGSRGNPNSQGLPAPVLGQSANVAAVTGRVSVRLPGAGGFVALSSIARQIPYGTVVEASHGEVRVTAATPAGGTQTGLFFDGKFTLTQGSNGTVLARLTGGDFAVCPPRTLTAGARHARTSSKYASPTHLVRRLWANVGGSFSIRGHYAEGVVKGAEWLTEDMCAGTLVLATRNRVEVTNLLRHRRVALGAGRIYLAKAH